MKAKTPQQKAEQQQAEQLRMNCFERAQQLNGYTADINLVLVDAKKIHKYIKGK